VKEAYDVRLDDGGDCGDVGSLSSGVGRVGHLPGGRWREVREKKEEEW
jgi:hypothetical protein